MENEILDDSMMGPKINLVPASKGKRFANYLIDYIALIVLLMVILFTFLPDLMDPLAMEESGSDLLLNLLSIIVFVFYYLLSEAAMGGKTLGKIVTKTRAVKQDGTPMEMNDVLLRSLSRIVPFEPFSFLGQRPDGWHDRWTKTMVIDENESTLPREGNWMN